VETNCTLALNQRLGPHFAFFETAILPRSQIKTVSLSPVSNLPIFFTTFLPTHLNVLLTFYITYYLHIWATIVMDYNNSMYMPHIRHHKSRITPKFLQFHISQKYTTTSKRSIPNILHNNTQKFISNAFTCKR